MGTAAANRAWSSGSSAKAFSIAGVMASGETAATVTPAGAHSRAKLFAMPRSAAFTMP